MNGVRREIAGVVLACVVLACAGLVIVSHGMPAKAADPKRPSRSGWVLDFGGPAPGYFTVVTGLGSEIEVVEHRIVNQAGREMMQATPGKTRWSEVELRRGLSSDIQMADWHSSVVASGEGRRNVNLKYYDEAANLVAEWLLTNAWPCACAVNPPGAGAGDGPVEVIRLAYDGMKRIR
ncbi:MAG: phage tail protein [Bacillota bacterium]